MSRDADGSRSAPMADKMQDAEEEKLRWRQADGGDGSDLLVVTIEVSTDGVEASRRSRPVDGVARGQWRRGDVAVGC